MTHAGQSRPSQALFETWLEDMHPRLSRFVDLLMPASVPGDFSRESLTGLEGHLLELFPDPEQYFRGERELDFIDGAVRYVGESFLREFGGGWHFSEDPSLVVSGRPFVLLGTPNATPISPYNLLGAALHRRTGRVLAKVYDGQVRAIAERQATDPTFRVEREAVPGVHVSHADEERRRSAGADYLSAWIQAMDPTLARWREELGARTDQLDGTADSLPRLETLVLEQLPDVAALESAPNKAFVTGATYYLGSVFQACAGGQWRYLPGDPDPRLRLVGRPYLERNDADGDPRRSVPELVLRGLVRKRTAGTLLNAYRVYSG